MTLVELRDYVLKVYSVEEMVTFDKATSLLEAFDVVEYMDQFEYALGPHYSGAESNAIDAIRINLLASTRTLVNFHGIQLDEDVTQAQVNAILEALYLLQGWEDRTTIDDILAQDIADTDKFCELMKEVLGHEHDEFLLVVESVTPDLFEQIKSVLTQEELEAAGLADIKKIEAYRTFRSKVVSTSLWADRYVLLTTIGETPFKDLLPLWLSDSAKEIDEANTPEQYLALAEQLLGLAAVSAEGLSAAMTLVEDNQEALYRDMPRAVALAKVVKDKYVEVNRG